MSFRCVCPKMWGVLKRAYNITGAGKNMEYTLGIPVDRKTGLLMSQQLEFFAIRQMLAEQVWGITLSPPRVKLLMLRRMVAYASC